MSSVMHFENLVVLNDFPRSKFGDVEGLISNTVSFTKHDNFNCYTI